MGFALIVCPACDEDGYLEDFWSDGCYDFQCRECGAEFDEDE